MGNLSNLFLWVISHDDLFYTCQGHMATSPGVKLARGGDGGGEWRNPHIPRADSYFPILSISSVVFFNLNPEYCDMDTTFIIKHKRIFLKLRPWRKNSVYIHKTVRIYVEFMYIV